MATLGGRIVAEGLELLTEELDNYFGAISQLKSGTTIILPEMPEALVYYYMCNDMKMSLVEGGIYDQPHIWLLEYGICQKRKEIYEQVNKMNLDKTITNPNADSDDLDIKFDQDQ